MKKTINFTVTAAMIAAIYAVLTLAIAPISFGQIQLRISEAMIMFACITPAAIPGLTIGCVLSNLASPYGIIDIILGSTATLLAAAFAYSTRKIQIKKLPWLSPLGAVIFNAFLVSLSIKIVSGSEVLYLLTTFQIGVGQVLACYGLGFPLWFILQKTNLMK
ncbi:MAG: QueT transporter family protein [Ruminococcaceae bacterium]|nr:QueT transporter family protein [Oscillospiraceae bacterium]